MMKLLNLILVAAFSCSTIPVVYADSNSAQTAATTTEEQQGPVVRTMRGKISAINVTRKTFKIVPDNIGEPIDITCEPEATCKVDGMTEGMDASAEVYYQDGKWIAKSVKQS